MCLDSPKKRFALYLLIGELIPFNMTIYLLNLLIEVFIPIMGRSGPGANPNIFLALITAAISAILAFNGLAAFLVGFKKIHLSIILGLSMIVINGLLVFGFVGKIPYQEKTSMRLNLIVSRKFSDGQ